MSEIMQKLKDNVETEINMFKEIAMYNQRIDEATENEREMYLAAIDSLRKELKIINQAIPRIILNISLARELPNTKDKAKATGLEEIRFEGANRGLKVALDRKDREKFIEQLRISEGFIKKLKKKSLAVEKKNPIEFKKSRGYLKLSNKYFLEKATELSKKGYFDSLAVDLKKASLSILLETYVAMMLFTTVLSIGAGLLIMLFFLFFNVGVFFPFVSVIDENIFLRFAKVFWIVFAVPAITFLALYLYPSTEKSSMSKKIDQEIPFAVIHMSAISGSGIAPAEIFRIIGLSPEYPNLGKEVIKVLNQINLYGYDLGTALNNASKSSPNQRLAELFSGLATTINSGGDMNEFFEKRAETLMLQYRLEREKFTKMAETFMDIYISVVIATPMILMLLLMMISITGSGIGLGPTQIGLIIVGIIALINVFFLFFLNIKQPTY